MKLAVDRLDSIFGPVKWGTWSDRSPRVNRRICTCGKVYNIDPGWSQCSWCYRLEDGGESCGEIGVTVTVDGAQSIFDPESLTCSPQSVALGVAPAKKTLLSRKLVVAFYQALFERLLVSRLATCDIIDGDLSSIIASSGGTAYDISPLNCFVDHDFCGLPDFPGDYSIYSLLEAASRKVAGALGRGYPGARISDGKVARAAMTAVNKFIKNPKTRHTWMYANCLFPPTPTKTPDGKLPTFGSGVLVSGWFDGGQLQDDVWQSDDMDAKIAALKTKVLPRFGAGNFEKNPTNTWLSDFSMRKPASYAGLDCLPEADRALLFRAVLEAVAEGGFDLDRPDLDGIASAYASQSTRTDEGDPSGDFAATCGDVVQGVELANALECHNRCTLISPKMSAIAIGYAATVLGAFGQNTVSFGRPYYRHRFLENVVTGSKLVDYVPLLSVVKCNCTINSPLGYNPMTERLSWEFYACSVSESAHFATRESCTIGVGASVSGFGGALPWFGGDVILYIGPAGDCAWNDLECRCVSIDELLGRVDIPGGETTYCDYYWRLRHELPREGGFNHVTFCFSWTCNECNLPRTACHLNYDYSCSYLTTYPARSVLLSKLIEYLRDVHVYYTLLDSATKFTTCFFHVEQRGFNADCLDASILRAFMEECDHEPFFHYLDDSHRKLLSMIDAYVKSPSELCIRSTGISQFYKFNRRPGDSIPGVHHPTTFPITREMIFQGEDALIDPRLEDELTNEINKDCNILTCGCWPVAVYFGYFGVISGVAVRNIKTGQLRHLGVPDSVTFRCREGGEEYHGWRVGRLQTTGLHGPWKCKYEPYALAVEHEIRPGVAFGVVRWDYKVMRRVGE